MKTWVQQQQVMPAIWRALLSGGMEGVQHIKVLAPPSTLKEAAWTQCSRKREFAAACLDYG